MLGRKFNNLFGLPELEFFQKPSHHKHQIRLYCRKTSKMEVCPKCATPSTTGYDKSIVSIKDQPLRDKQVYLTKESLKGTAQQFASESMSFGVPQIFLT